MKGGLRTHHKHKLETTGGLRQSPEVHQIALEYSMMHNHSHVHAVVYPSIASSYVPMKLCEGQAHIYVVYPREADVAQSQIPFLYQRKWHQYLHHVPVFDTTHSLIKVLLLLISQLENPIGF